MPVISVLNPKGGSGKTTISTNLARAFHERGHNVLMVDSDPQGSARDWHAASRDNPLSLVALDRASSLRSLKGLAVAHHIVIVDGAAKLEDMLAGAIKASDLVLIPVQPSPYDLWATTDLVDIIRVRQQITDGQPDAAFIVNRIVAGTVLGTEVQTVLAEQGIGVLRAQVAQRQVYPRTAANGETVFDAKDKAGKAEIAALADEVLERINQKGGMA